MAHTLIGWGHRLLNTCASTPVPPSQDEQLQEVMDMVQEISSDPRPVEEIVEGPAPAVIDMPFAFRYYDARTNTHHMRTMQDFITHETFDRQMALMNDSVRRSIQNGHDDVNRRIRLVEEAMTSLQAELAANLDNTVTQRREALEQVRARAAAVRAANESVTQGMLGMRPADPIVTMSPMAEAVQDAARAVQAMMRQAQASPIPTVMSAGAQALQQEVANAQTNRVRELIMSIQNTPRSEHLTNPAGEIPLTPNRNGDVYIGDPVPVTTREVNSNGEVIYTQRNRNRGSEFIASDFHLGQSVSPIQPREPAPTIRHEPGDRNLDQTI